MKGMEVFLMNREDGKATVCDRSGKVLAVEVPVHRYAYLREHFQFIYNDSLWECWLFNWGRGEAYVA